MTNLIIRRNKVMDLVLSMTAEKVYFLFHHGQPIFNDIDYDRVSDKFNEIVGE